MKLGANSKKYFQIQNQISQYFEQLKVSLKSYNCFSIFLLFGSFVHLEHSGLPVRPE